MSQTDSTVKLEISSNSNVILMRHTKLKDDPTVRWREELVSDIILRQVLVNYFFEAIFL